MDKIISIQSKNEKAKQEKLFMYTQQMNQISEDVKGIIDVLLDEFLYSFSASSKLQISKTLRDFKEESQESYNTFTALLFGILCYVVAKFPGKIQISYEDIDIISQDILGEMFLRECEDIIKDNFSDEIISQIPSISTQTLEARDFGENDYENILEEIETKNFPKKIYFGIIQRYQKSGYNMNFKLLRENYSQYEKGVWITMLSLEVFHYFSEEGSTFSKKEILDFIEEIIDIHIEQTPLTPFK